MLLKASPAFFSIMDSCGVRSSPHPLFSSASASHSSSSLALLNYSSSNLRILPLKRGSGFIFCASDGASTSAVSSFLFEPFEEVKKEFDLVPASPHVSLARHKYSDDSEAAINEQINVEYSVSYVYHSMYAYFDRDNVALKGLAKFFKESSDEEREHAELLMEYQNTRGGKVKLQSILPPPTEFDHAEKGDALYAMELALSLEKLNNEKLINLHQVSQRNHDVEMADFIESTFLVEQVESIGKISEYVAQLRRVGKGYGVWHFDQMLLQDNEAVGA